MQAIKIISGLLACSLFLGACASMSETQQDTAKGAAIGATAGAVLGAVINHDKPAKGAAIGAAIGGAGGAVAGNVWSKKMQEQRQQMEQATRGTGVEVTQTANNELKLEIPSDISFDSNSAAIKPQMRPILDRFAQTLRDNPVTRVRIIGHTDSSGTDAINNPLSVNRATSARDYLADRGVAASRITVDGRGSREPVADNSTAAGRAKNRRIEIFVAEQQG
ncbi:OmpA family protein [Uliginosibacterium sp. sgz301328]|uniref:OmpA family protein n=1 Tax=Uliginosibacterium sp. sgz301328 TaxID=3243764 RepID=UPI00359EB965